MFAATLSAVVVVVVVGDPAFPELCDAVVATGSFAPKLAIQQL